MQCLAHGGVQHTSLLNIFKNQLDEEFKVFDEFPSSAKGTTKASELENQFSNALVKLYDFVSRAESVPQSRLRREAVGLSRALGYGDNSNQTDYDYTLDDGADDIGEQSTAWAPDLVSGLPSSLAETVMAFLASGFRPWEHIVLYDKLKALLKMTIDTVVVRYKVGLPLSAEGFAIPGRLLFVARI